MLALWQLGRRRTQTVDFVTLLVPDAGLPGGSRRLPPGRTYSWLGHDRVRYAAACVSLAKMCRRGGVGATPTRGAHSRYRPMTVGRRARDPEIRPSAVLPDGRVQAIGSCPLSAVRR
jgi:hypothetical protein